MLRPLTPFFLMAMALALQGSLPATGGSAVVFVSPDPHDGTGLRRLVEEAEKTFFRTTGWDAGDAPPILLNTMEKGSSASLSVNATESGGPGIRLMLPKDPDDQQVPLFLSTALLLRQFYGNKGPVPGSAVPSYPVWLTRGLGTLILGRSIHDQSFGASPELAAFLSEHVPDPLNVSLLGRYDEIASVLVRAGLSDEAGRKAFRDWIGCFDPLAPPRPASSWVGGWEMRTVERRWVLGLHVPGEKDQSSIRIRSASSSLEEYERIMREGLSGKNTLAEVARDPGGEFPLQRLSQQLAALRLQGNPLVVPLIEESMLLVNKAKRLSPRKALRMQEQLGAYHLFLTKRARAIEDYLDWFEAARVPVASGLFDRYLSSPDPIVRKGPVGRHLDAVEARGW